MRRISRQLSAGESFCFVLSTLALRDPSFSPSVAYDTWMRQARDPQTLKVLPAQMGTRRVGPSSACFHEPSKRTPLGVPNLHTIKAEAKYPA